MEHATADSEDVSLRLSARIWAGIDGDIDNVVSLAAVKGDEEALRIGSAIRQAGWDQVPWIDGEWPPDDQMIKITLTRGQWRFVVAESERSTPIYEELGDTESVELGREAVKTVTEQLR